MLGLAMAAVASYAGALELIRGGAGGFFGLHDDYSFWIEGASADVIIWGREGSPAKQAVHVEYYGYYMEDNEGHIAELKKGNYFFLKDDRGNVYYPKAVEERGGCGFYESAAAVLEFQFEGAFRGDLRLGVKAKGGKTEWLDFGPAERSYYRLATVTEPAGLNFRNAPSVEAGVNEVLRAGDTVYVTAFHEIYWPEDASLDEAILFHKVIRDGEVGWVAGDYIKINGFEAF